MDNKSFSVTILSQEKKLYEGNVVSLIVPSEMGYMGVLANHASLVANLALGRITLREPSDKTVVINSKGKGFIEVIQNKVTLLLSSAPG